VALASHITSRRAAVFKRLCCHIPDQVAAVMPPAPLPLNEWQGAPRDGSCVAPAGCGLPLRAEASRSPEVSTNARSEWRCLPVPRSPERTSGCVDGALLGLKPPAVLSGSAHRLGVTLCFGTVLRSASDDLRLLPRLCDGPTVLCCRSLSRPRHGLLSWQNKHCWPSCRKPSLQRRGKESGRGTGSICSSAHKPNGVHG
jgi:hypothetical protein